MQAAHTRRYVRLCASIYSLRPSAAAAGVHRKYQRVSGLLQAALALRGNTRRQTLLCFARTISIIAS